jgi:hypothetical protein
MLPSWHRTAGPDRSVKAGRELSIDQNKRDPAVAAGSVGPTLIGAALDHDVTRLHRGLIIIEDQGHLALQHNPIVDAFGAMHERMARIGIGGGAACPAPICAKCRPRRSRVNPGRRLGFRLNVEHPDARAIAGRRQRQLGFMRLTAAAVDLYRRLARIPDLIKGRTMRA